MATVTLKPGEMSDAVTHRSVEDPWFGISGCGRMWRRDAIHEDTVALEPGLCLKGPWEPGRDRVRPDLGDPCRSRAGTTLASDRQVPWGTWVALDIRFAAAARHLLCERGFLASADCQGAPAAASRRPEDHCRDPGHAFAFSRRRTRRWLTAQSGSSRRQLPLRRLACPGGCGSALAAPAFSGPR
jgi:hypothetical protein